MGILRTVQCIYISSRENMKIAIYNECKQTAISTDTHMYI